MSTSTIVTATGDTITGLSGRTLKLSKFMKSNNIGNEYRLGSKNLMDLYPSRVRDKIVADAKLKQWDEANKKALSEASREIADFESKNSSEFIAISLFAQLNHRHHRFQAPTVSALKTN